MFGSVRVDLGAIQANPANLQQLHFLCQFQHLHEQVLQLTQETAAEVRQSIVVRMTACCKITEGDGIVGGLFQFAAGKHAVGVTVDQNGQQRGRMISLAASTRILLHQARDIQLLNHLNDKAGEVSFREPVLHGRGQQDKGFCDRGR